MKSLAVEVAAVDHFNIIRRTLRLDHHTYRRLAGLAIVDGQILPPFGIDVVVFPEISIAEEGLNQILQVLLGFALLNRIIALFQ